MDAPAALSGKEADKRKALMAIGSVVVLVIVIVVIVLATKPAKVVNPIVGLPVFELGVEGVAPWGTGAKFVDPTAQFIWNTKEASTNASAGSVILAAAYNNKTKKPITAVLHGIVDNESEVSILSAGSKKPEILGNMIGGWGNPAYPQLPVTLAPGVSIIFVYAINTLEGPAGALLALVDDQKKVLLNSNAKDWFCGSGMSFDGKVLTLK